MNGNNSIESFDKYSIQKIKAEEEEFRLLLPESGFFKAYMDYSDYQDSPGSFHFWVAATVLGAGLQRQVWIHKGVYNIYTNLYTVLVAPSGKCRKSTAIKIGMNTIPDWDRVNVLGEKSTPEALLQSLQFGTKYMEIRNTEEEKDKGKPVINLKSSGRSTGLISSAELSVFINKTNYVQGMVSLLTDLYDCPNKFRYLTRNKQPVILRNVALSLLAATTPDWLAHNLPTDAFEGGFMSRIIFVVRHNRDRIIAWNEVPNPDIKEAVMYAYDYLLNNLSGEVTISEKAYNWYIDWYNNINYNEIHEKELLGYIERKPDTLLKLAMLLANSLDRMEIHLNDMETALNILTWTQKRMFQAFENVNLSKAGTWQKDVLTFIIGNDGRATRREILRKFGKRFERGVEDWRLLEQIMIQAGDIEIHNKNKSIYYILGPNWHNQVPTKVIRRKL